MNIVRSIQTNLLLVRYIYRMCKFGTVAVLVIVVLLVRYIYRMCKYWQAGALPF